MELSSLLNFKSCDILFRITCAYRANQFIGLKKLHFTASSITPTVTLVVCMYIYGFITAVLEVKLSIKKCFTAKSRQAYEKIGFKRA